VLAAMIYRCHHRSQSFGIASKELPKRHIDHCTAFMEVPL
jgi:hypothetical protein